MEKDKKNVLVVDDDESILRVFSRILGKNGYIVDVARTGKEAIAKAQTSSYAVILLDIQLPDIDGTDLLLKLPGNASETVKIIVTGHSTTERGVKAADYGADDYLVKPVKPEELLATIRERLEELQKRKS